MTRLALLLLTVAAPEPGAQFGYSPQQAMDGWLTAQKYLAYVRANYLPDAIGRAQLADAEWRFACWNTLDNLKRCARDNESRADHAAILRGLLGEANFKAGWMPQAVPVER